VYFGYQGFQNIQKIQSLNTNLAKAGGLKVKASEGKFNVADSTRDILDAPADNQRKLPKRI